MKLSQVYVDSPQSPAKASLDNSDVQSLTERLNAVADELWAMSSSVASARVVKEMHGDRMKRSLATAQREFLIAGDSAAAAEVKARASAMYGEQMQQLRHELEIAEQALCEHDAKKAIFEAARSSLSMAKTIAGLL